jgi:hypothetical protein
MALNFTVMGLSRGLFSSYILLVILILSLLLAPIQGNSESLQLQMFPCFYVFHLSFGAHFIKKNNIFGSVIEISY